MEFIERATTALNEIVAMANDAKHNRALNGRRLFELAERVEHLRRFDPRPAWTPFVRVETLEGEDEAYQNSRYLVFIKRQKPHCELCAAGREKLDGKHYNPMAEAAEDCVADGPELRTLSIRSLDRGHLHDWRDFQRIKNELLGPEEEAVELYPAESRLVDTSNHYFLFSVEGTTIDLGFTDQRLVVENAPGVGHVQRPFPEDARPADLKTVTPEVIAEEKKKHGL